MKHFEVNFDGIAGPTHHFGGLSFGNIASMQNKHHFSNPKKAALQCLKKMKFLHDLGLIQAIIPPQERPHLPTLRKLGFQGTEEEIIYKAYKNAPELFFLCSSSSAMWTANCATITPSIDTNNLVKITPANLNHEFHRSIECESTTLLLKKIFSDNEFFFHCPPLPSVQIFSDEGAANHTRFCEDYGSLGVHLFVYGKSIFNKKTILPSKYPARHTLEASQAIARQHNLDLSHVIFAQQNPKAIDLGVFHNDVISVGNRNLFFYHEDSFINTDEVIDKLLEKMDLELIKVSNKEVALEDAVNTYLFNSQLISNNDNSMTLIAPKECEENQNVKAFIDSLINKKTTISKVYFIDLRESMLNGGGPACLRIRVVLNEKEVKAMNQNVILTETLYLKLVDWAERHYRDQLSPYDLADPKLLTESHHALDELSKILNLGSIFSFQNK